MKAKGKLAENLLITQQILIGPNFCGPRPPAIPKFQTKIDEKAGLLGDYNSMVAAMDLLYEAATSGNVAASEELRLLSFRAAELADQFATTKQKVNPVRA
ncbi:MAG: hypothetical protein ABSB82_12085 [Terriglobia bacterium]|jgi:hypothetical protein